MRTRADPHTAVAANGHEVMEYIDALSVRGTAIALLSARAAKPHRGNPVGTEAANSTRSIQGCWFWSTSRIEEQDKPCFPQIAGEE